MAKGHRRHLKAVAAYIERLEREGNHSKVESIRKAKCIRQLSKCIDDPTILEKLESERLHFEKKIHYSRVLANANNYDYLDSVCEMMILLLTCVKLLLWY
mmetsp:Transcript_13709/g.16670  ORF Transcript_13709/g.16670 Transcript_13709/m.16670 type:complete len:100 (+) Transcript_13709:1011-1310(+)